MRDIGCSQERPGLDVEISLSLEAHLPISVSFAILQSLPTDLFLSENALRRERVHGCCGWSRAHFSFLGPLHRWNAVFGWELRGW
jgi:hypothetical protein